MVWKKVNEYSKPLRISIIEGMFNSIMAGGGAVFIIPYAIFLGASNAEVSLIVALPALFSALIQLGAMRFLRIYKKRKSAIITSVILQSASWLLILAIPFLFPQGQVFWITIIYTLGSVFGAIGVPLWQSWMKSLTPKEVVGEYFGIRNAITGTVVLLTTLLCGILLGLVEPSTTLYAFTAIMLVSFIGRALSAVLFTKIEEPQMRMEQEKIDLFSFIKQLKSTDFGQFILLGSVMTFTLAMVGPFMPVYLINTLGLSSNYLLYTAIIVASTLTSLISMPYWGKIIDNFGTITVIKATTLILVLHPIALIIIRDPALLIVVELVNGISLGGLTLCMASFIYEAFDAEKIMKYAIYQGVLFGMATFLGAMVAGYVLEHNVSWAILTNSFYILCVLAAAIRLAVYAGSATKLREISSEGKIKSEKLVISILTFGPLRESALANITPLVSTAESITLGGITRAERATIRGITTAEEATKRRIIAAEEMSKKEIQKIEDAAEKRIRGNKGRRG